MSRVQTQEETPEYGRKKGLYFGPIRAQCFIHGFIIGECSLFIRGLSQLINRQALAWIGVGWNSPTHKQLRERGRKSQRKGERERLCVCVF